MRFWGAPAAVVFSLLQMAAAFSQGLSAGGDGLSLKNTFETLDQRFNELPAWREGGIQVDAPVMPLNHPSFSWAAGYIWNHPLAGHPSPWPQPVRDFPAWTSNGYAGSVHILDGAEGAMCGDLRKADAGHRGYAVSGLTQYGLGTSSRTWCCDALQHSLRLVSDTGLASEPVARSAPLSYIAASDLSKAKEILI
jgi:hypothetical protein